LCLKLKKEDEYIIVKMFSKFSNGYTVIIDKNSSSMSLSSTRLIHVLSKLGCVENKTDCGFNLPDMPMDLFRHFARGYFDGDGSVGIRASRPNQIQVYICSIDNNFLVQFQEKLIEFNILSSIYKEKRKNKSLKRPNGEYSTNNQDMYRLTFTTHKERLKFYEFIYYNSNIKLSRKYDKYRKYYISTALMLNKKNSNCVEIVKDNIHINYETMNDKIFYCGNEIDEQLVLNMFADGKSKFGRRAIKNILSKL
jgi:hypothetical protein